jgi:N utilization substance protein A
MLRLLRWVTDRFRPGRGETPAAPPARAPAPASRPARRAPHAPEVDAIFAREVPEIRAGTVRIEASVRRPRQRVKVAVSSREPAVDPVRVCVEPVDRIRAIVEGLGGEKVDIVPFDPDPAMFATNAVAPAAIERIVIDDEARSMELYVADAVLQSAHGKDGLNFILAADLTGWRLVPLPLSRYRAADM